jgi:hypothetical protein
VRVILSDEVLEVRLSLWERVLGLLGSIRVRRADITDARVVEDPMREAMTSGIKVGLRLPWLYYVARNVRLDQAFIVRRRAPGLAVTIDDERRLKRVLVSTPEAQQIAAALDAA